MIVWHPAIAPIDLHAAFPAEQVARGAELAAIGDCAVCHTVVGGPPFAGGRGVPTPFGTVFATNITPDRDTGIGQWSLAAFQRAMRDGIDRSGRHLYPVLPYPHFTRASDDDIAAMYAFLMTRAAVHASAPANRLPFPLDNRVLLGGGICCISTLGRGSRIRRMTRLEPWQRPGRGHRSMRRLPYATQFAGGAKGRANVRGRGGGGLVCAAAAARIPGHAALD